MLNNIELNLCDTQGQVFEMAGKLGYESINFIKLFMNSSIASDMDKPFNHMQWAGKNYILSRMRDECSSELIFGKSFDGEALYWTGYIYRYWHFLTGESSKQIYRQAPAKTMNIVFFPYHAMSPEMAIERLQEVYSSRHLKKR